MMTHRTSQLGFSLIEMMIASLVGLILMAGTMQMFSSTKQSSRTSTAVTRMQENGRAGLYFIENAIRLSGYRPDSLKDFSVSFPGTSANFDFNGKVIEVIRGFNNDPVGSDNDILDGTDRILMRYQGNDDELIRDCIGAWAKTGYTIEVAFLVNDNEELVCASDPALKPPPDLAPAPNLTPNPDLTHTDNWHPLIEGVEDMQILYGVDKNSDFTADFYVTSNQIPANSEVISARISLFLKSDAPIATQAQRYRLNGQWEVDPHSDKRHLHLHKVFSSTTAVRNLVD